MRPKTPALKDGKDVNSQCVNTFEGRVLKYFNKYVKHNTELSLSTILRNLADYLGLDQKQNPFHIDMLNSKSKYLKRCKKESIIALIEKDFGIKESLTTCKQKLISTYLNHYKRSIEND